jgi:hypothetical protein
MLTKDIKLKAIIRLQFLMVMACMLSGWLAGVNIERYLVRVPAWRKMDILIWAEYTQHSYHGYGFILYQTEVSCCLVLLVLSAFIVLRHTLKFVAWPVYIALLLTTIAIAFTFLQHRLCLA